MPSYIIVYADSYKDDVIEISDWYQKINENISDKFILELKESEDIILSAPLANARIFETKYRRFLMAVFPYKIVYGIKDFQIIVFALIHTARSNKFVKKRLKKSFYPQFTNLK